jgi:putative flippase GtrA
VTTNSCAREIEPQSLEEVGAKEDTLPKSESSGRARATLVRWLKFNFVGAIGIAVQFVVLFLLKGVLRLNYLAATAIAVEAAVVHNFIWHEKFTWVDRIKANRIFTSPVKTNQLIADRRTADCARTSSLLRFVSFNLSTGAVSILGNLGLMKMLVGQGHMNYLLGNAVAIVLCSLANFLVSDGWVFDTDIR